MTNRGFSPNANSTKRKKPKRNKFRSGVAPSDRQSKYSIGDARFKAANYFMAASAAIANGDEVAAIDMMDRAIELAPTDSSYYSFSSNSKFKNLGRVGCTMRRRAIKHEINQG